MPRTRSAGAIPTPTRSRSATGATSSARSNISSGLSSASAVSRADEQRIRSELALIPTPADHDPLVLALGSNLAEQAEARVVLRDAREIVARAEDVVAAAAAALARASASLERAAAWVASATARQRQIEQLAAEIAAGDLATVVADATIARGAPLNQARTRLAARLPAALLTRSGERYAEAAAVVEAAAAIVSAAQLERDELAKLARPMVAAVDVADRTLDSATTRLHDYVTGAVAAPGPSAGPADLGRQPRPTDSGGDRSPRCCGSGAGGRRRGGGVGDDLHRQAGRLRGEGP